MMRAPMLATLCGLSLLSGCMVGPDYHRPNAPVPLAYRETPPPPPGWELARPDDGGAHGAWWAVFRDPTLAGLEARVTVNNQNIKQAEAAYREARALVDEARAALFPTIAANGNVSRNHASNLTYTNGQVEATGSWDLDVWGRIRRSVESSKASAQASAADLANAKLSSQATLATLYFELCYQDALEKLLADTVNQYQRALTITTNQAQFGVAAPADVITAKTQLEGAQSQLISAGIARAQYAHAIAVLAGVPPTDFDLPKRDMTSNLPQIPVAIPTTLLQRRPDIAAAERSMQAENAQIGVAIAAFFPDISLSGSIAQSGTPLSMLFNASREAWTLGVGATETIFEGGLRSAQVAAARATYDQSVATYRQTVLTAFQQVEDNLSDLRILAQQAVVQDQADRDAARAVAIALNEYEYGTQNYTAVVTQQAILLGDRETDLQIQLQRLTDSVSLLQALGGDWDSSELPKHP